MLKHLKLLMLIIGLSATPAHAFTLSVVDAEGQSLDGGFRYLVEQDVSLESIPGQPAIPGQQRAVSFHSSYAPVLLSGDSDAAGNSVDINLPSDTAYFVSVLPKNGHAMGGAPVAIGQSDVRVLTHEEPIQTAQISIFVFEDISPINNAPDLPEETGLGGFAVLLEEAGGRYGASGGAVMQDAYGNPIGTTYDADGDVAAIGNGAIVTDENGFALIENLSPGKYGIQIIPPTGEDWHQTTTIEGTHTIDAWVKAGEPAFFAEFGPPGYHVFVGFVHTMTDDPALTGGSTITGRVVNLHTSRPPDYAFYAGDPVGGAWVGLNDSAIGEGQAVYAAPCDPETGEFSIPNVPPGVYQLAIWDENLDVIFASLNMTIAEEYAEIDLLDIPVFNWFSKIETAVFYDENENGFWDDGEVPMPEQAITVRWRDGTIYASAPTDFSGKVPFDELFPFFNWLVAEVDFTRFKATGVTTVVDAGGAIEPDLGWENPSFDKLTPQPQCESHDPATGACIGPIINPNTGNNLSTTWVGPVLTLGFQVYLGQTNVMQFGQKAYEGEENGGLSGVIFYATTRAEDDPRFAAAEPWEPGIPRVQVNLYADENGDQIIDDLNGDGLETLADVDNHPFNWQEEGQMGPEDIDRNDDGNFDYGDAIQISSSDSWDDAQPTDCRGAAPFIAHGVPTDCYDGLRNFNQVRPAVFDGGWAFNSYFPGGMGDGAEEVEGLPNMPYIVEAVPPPGYEVAKEEDRNVDFGDEYTTPEKLLPAPCVGAPHVLPAEMTLFPGVPVPAYDPADPGKTTLLCDRKAITLNRGANAAADFFLFTQVPIAAHLTGFILDDLANEFDPHSPNFGEKFAPPWLPVSIRDWSGAEISRVYADEWGNYNALVPSTFSTNLPFPSGMAPNMLTTCMNSPGPIVDERLGSPTQGQLIEDPYFNRQYSQFCYTFQYMPGTTTYLDTPVVPVAAFAGPGQFPLDCDFDEGTPSIYSVSGSLGGPYVSVANGTQQVTIVSQGDVEVPNPLYDGANGVEPKTILRDLGFGSALGQVSVGGVDLTVDSWTGGVINATVPPNIKTGELQVVRANGKSSILGVTLTVGGPAPLLVRPGGSIQSAIDAAPNNSLVLVAPGTYEERVILWKPLQLQGWGAGSTIINAVNVPSEKLEEWRRRTQALVDADSRYLLPNQPNGGGFPEPELFGTEEGPGILVMAKDAPRSQGGFTNKPNARIDGFTITGADTGGGIFVNGYAHYLEISNNRIIGNQGFYGGGIRLGHPKLVIETDADHEYVSSENNNISIHNNQITQNGGLGGAGGGLSLHTGADDYRIEENFICGNFSQGNGGGVGHEGLSDDGRIARNTIIFNQSFNQGGPVSGGGISIAGAPGLVEAMTPGSGSVSIDRNVIQGNLAGAGNGGGIQLSNVNGLDVAATPRVPGAWHSVSITNNTLANNVAGLAGGGLSFLDALVVEVINNTIVNNDSTATTQLAFDIAGDPNQSSPRPGGIVSYNLSTDLYNAIPFRVQQYKLPYSNPVLLNNIIWHNRSFTFFADENQDPTFYGLNPDIGADDPPSYWDLAVLGATGDLEPHFCLLTDATPYAADNLEGDPAFISDYVNGARSLVQIPESTTSIEVAPAFDEGGNFIDVRFGPLTLVDPATGLLFGNYHLSNVSDAIDAGNNSVLIGNSPVDVDIDGENRPKDGSGDGISTVDMGGDER